MAVSTPISTTRDFELRDGLTITVEEQGDTAASAGTGVLLLHGGAGPRSMTGLAVALSQQAYVITPTHPGFDGRPRPDWVDSIADLAVAYLDLLDALDLHKVLVIGSSVGGWIAAEMALRDTHGRVGGLTLLNAVGIKPEAPLEIAELAKVGPVEFGRMAFHNPQLRPNPAALSEEQQAAMAANQRTLAVYSGDPYAHDPKLIHRLHRVTVPVLVAWGEHDGIAPLEYGRAFANAFPKARFEPISGAAHFPHIEQAGQTLRVIEDFVNTEIKPDGE